jgi:membrane protein insertase Oxa1/YidC/SpoIIIJ
MSKPPEPGPELIPSPYRIPFFIGLVVVSLIALAMVVRFVVIPGIKAQQSSSTDTMQLGLRQGEVVL